jgi:hypothetical protein
MFKNQEHVFQKVDYKQIKEALSSTTGTYIILFAFDPDFYECPFCFTCMPIINEAALAESVDQILYLDIYGIRTNNSEEYQWIVNNLDSRVDDLMIRDNQKRIVVPDLYVIKDGEILDHHIATFPNGEGGFMLDLTVDQKVQLKLIYQEMFQKIK